MYFSLQKNSGVAAYQQIVDAVRSGICNGQFAIGEQLETEQALASRLGVSRPTVSKAYEHLRIMKIIASEQGRGSYIAESAFEALDVKPVKPMRRIGFLVSAIGQMSQIPLSHRHQTYDALEGISGRLQTSNALLAYICIGRWKSQGKPSQQELSALGHQLSEFDGLLMISEPKIANPIIPLIREAQIPCVSLYNPYKDKAIAHVIYNRAGAVRLAVEHLVNQGYESIGYIGPDDRKTEGKRSKYVAFHESIAAGDLALDRDHVWKVKNHNARAAVGQALACRKNLPQAFFIACDYYAMQSMLTFQEAGINIPDDIGLISYDNVAEFSLTRPQLSTVSVPRFDIGYQAADMLFNWPMQGAAPENKVLQPSLVQRETCPGPLVAA